VVSIATLNDWLAHGANVNEELSHAILGDDMKRVAYLVEKKHADIMPATCRARRPAERRAFVGTRGSSPIS